LVCCQILVFVQEVDFSLVVHYEFNEVSRVVRQDLAKHVSPA